MGLGSFVKKAIKNSIDPLGIGKKLLGDGDNKDISLADPFQNFNIGGLTGKKENGQVVIAPTDERKQLVGDLGGIYSNQASAMRGFLPQIDTAFNDFIGTVNNDLLPQVKPGFGALSQAQADAFGLARKRLDDSRRSRLSNLKEDLDRRKIGGSSFAQDDRTRVEAEYDMIDRELATSEAESRANVILQELDATTQLIEKSHTANVQKINASMSTLNSAFSAEAAAKGVALDDMNNVLEIGTNILNKTTALSAQNAQMEYKTALAEANAKTAQMSQLFGVIGGAAGMMIGGPAGAAVGASLGPSIGSQMV